MSGNNRDEGGSTARARWDYGCLFTKSGDEEKIVSLLAAEHAEADAIAPVKVRYRRSAGLAQREEVRLFPGYIFFRLPHGGDERVPWLWRLPARLLLYGDGSWRMRGDDVRTVRLFFDEGGVVELSTAYYENDRIHILDGFLKHYEGSITRVNHRAKTAEIKVQLQDKTLTLWLGFELIERADKPAKDGQGNG